MPAKKKKGKQRNGGLKLVELYGKDHMRKIARKRWRKERAAKV